MRTLCLPVLLALAACGGAPSAADAGTDAGVDGGPPAFGSCAAGCSAPFACDPASGLCKNHGVPRLSHAFVIVMENTSASDITAASAPYLTGTLYPLGVQMLNYSAVTHPSLPNYIAMVGGDTFGITSDGPANDPDHQVAASHPDVASQFEAAGLTWHEYSESQQTPCQLADSGSDPNAFVSKHDPMPHFLITQTSPSCAQNDVSFEPEPGMPGLAADLAAGRFFDYVFIAPNLCGDGHDSCPTVASSPVGQQDLWLEKNLPVILQSPAYLEAGLVVVTWDENDEFRQGPVPNQIPTIYLSPLLARAGGTNRTAYSHYSMLSTIEAGFGLPSLPAGNGHDDALITDIWR